MGIYEWLKKNTLYKAYFTGVIVSGTVMIGTAMHYGLPDRFLDKPRNVARVEEIRLGLEGRFLPQGGIKDILNPDFRDALVAQVRILEAEADSLEKLPEFEGEKRAYTDAYLNLRGRQKSAKSIQLVGAASGLIFLCLASAKKRKMRVRELQERLHEMEA